MSKFLSEVKGFTPVIDILAQELGLMAAVIYGIVWRYCQMEDHVCTASLDRIAEHANISRRTVERHIRDLCEAGYLEDRTPGKRHRPHIYADTGRAKITGLLTVEISTTESPTPDQSTTESPTSTTESRTEYDRESYLSTTESRIRIPSYDSIHESKEERKPDLFDLAQKTITAREEAGGNYAEPSHAGGADTLADSLIAIYCQHMGEAPPRGSEILSCRAAINKVLTAKGLRQDGRIAKRGMQVLLDPDGEYEWYHDKFILSVKNKPFIEYYGKVLARLITGGDGYSEKHRKGKSHATRQQIAPHAVERRVHTPESAAPFIAAIRGDMPDL